jgi:hypothetical protein
MIIMTRFTKTVLQTGLAAMALATAGNAQAAVFFIRYQGTVERGSRDETGVFGGGVRALDNLPFLLEYTVNDTIPGSAAYVEGNHLSRISGGHDYGGIEESPVTAILLIGNGYYSFSNIASKIEGSLELTKDTLFFTGVNEYVYADQVRLSVYRQGIDQNSRDTSFVNTFMTGSNILESGDYTRNFSFITTQFNIYDKINQFLIQDYCPIINSCTNGYANYASGQLHVDYVSLFYPAAIPEPAAWALMLAGFALTGAAMRRRRGTVTFSYS